MAENSKIEWCHHTFNPWRGCRAVSPACEHCYAKVLVEGWLQQSFDVRTRAADSTWRQPLAWDRKAAKLGVRFRVFCASLADVFDAEVPDVWRDELFALIAATPNLDWLLLTKRPKVAHDYALDVMRNRRFWPAGREGVTWPLPNVWLGTTVENQDMLAARWRWLRHTPAAVRFLSMEPLLGEVDLSETFGLCEPEGGGWTLKVGSRWEGSPDWVIVGGESGPKARPSHPDWFRDLRDQCAAAGVPFLMKQWGEWVPGECAPSSPTRTEQTATWINDGWEFGSITPRASQELHRDDEPDLYRLGKKAAGRLLDGVQHDGYPTARA